MDRIRSNNRWLRRCIFVLVVSGVIFLALRSSKSQAIYASDPNNSRQDNDGVDSSSANKDRILQDTKTVDDAKDFPVAKSVHGFQLGGDFDEAPATNDAEKGIALPQNIVPEGHVVVCHGTRSDVFPFIRMEIPVAEEAAHATINHNLGRRPDTIPGDEVIVGSQVGIVQVDCSVLFEDGSKVEAYSRTEPSRAQVESPAEGEIPVGVEEVATLEPTAENCEGKPKHKRFGCTPEKIDDLDKDEKYRANKGLSLDEEKGSQSYTVYGKVTHRPTLPPNRGNGPRLKNGGDTNVAAMGEITRYPVNEGGPDYYGYGEVTGGDEVGTTYGEVSRPPEGYTGHTDGEAGKDSELAMNGWVSRPPSIELGSAYGEVTREPGFDGNAYGEVTRPTSADYAAYGEITRRPSYIEGSHGEVAHPPSGNYAAYGFVTRTPVQHGASGDVGREPGSDGAALGDVSREEGEPGFNEQANGEMTPSPSAQVIEMPSEMGVGNFGDVSRPPNRDNDVVRPYHSQLVERPSLSTEMEGEVTRPPSRPIPQLSENELWTTMPPLQANSGAISRQPLPPALHPAIDEVEHPTNIDNPTVAPGNVDIGLPPLQYNAGSITIPPSRAQQVQRGTAVPTTNIGSPIVSLATTFPTTAGPTVVASLSPVTFPLTTQIPTVTSPMEAAQEEQPARPNTFPVPDSRPSAAPAAWGPTGEDSTGDGEKPSLTSVTSVPTSGPTMKQTRGPETEAPTVTSGHPSVIPTTDVPSSSPILRPSTRPSAPISNAILRGTPSSAPSTPITNIPLTGAPLVRPPSAPITNALLTYEPSSDSTDLPSSAPATDAPTVISGHPSVTPSTDGPSSGPTNNEFEVEPFLELSSRPTVVPVGEPSSSLTSGPTGRPTTFRPTTEQPTVASGHPSIFPTTSEPTTRLTRGTSSNSTFNLTSGPTSEIISGLTAGPTSGLTTGPTAEPFYGSTTAPSSLPPTTDAPTVVSGHPSASPTTSEPTAGPTIEPTSGPTLGSTISPSSGPSSGPTNGPTCEPSTLVPSTDVPTIVSGHPSFTPSTPTPTMKPTSGPTTSPTTSSRITEAPTVVSGHPSATPATTEPTIEHTEEPTHTPSAGPTVAVSLDPTFGPITELSASPTSIAPTSEAPTVVSGRPSNTPTTVEPTSERRVGPTHEPTHNPSIIGSTKDVPLSASPVHNSFPPAESQPTTINAPAIVAPFTVFPTLSPAEASIVSGDRPSTAPATGSPTAALINPPTGHPKITISIPMGSPAIYPAAVNTFTPTGSPNTLGPATETPTVVSGHPSTSPLTHSPTTIPMGGFSKTPTVAPTGVVTGSVIGEPGRFEEDSGSPTWGPTRSQPAPILAVLPTRKSFCLVDAGVTGQMCSPLTVLNGVTVGSLCIGIDSSYSSLELSYSVIGIWSLIAIKQWVGDSLGELKEYINNENFPQYWSDSNSNTNWTERVPLSTTNACDFPGISKTFAFSKALVGRKFSNGTLIPLTEEVATVGQDYLSSSLDRSELRYLEIHFDCNCLKVPSTTTPIMPTICLQTPEESGKKCFDLEIDSGKQVGELCLAIHNDGSSLEVSFRSKGVWALLNAEFWEGSSPLDAPTGQKSQYFPYVWESSSGDLKWTFSVMFLPDDLCSSGKRTMTRYAVASTVVGRTFLNGTFIGGTEEIAVARGTSRNGNISDGDLIHFTLVTNCGNNQAAKVESNPEAQADCFNIPELLNIECHALLTGTGLLAGKVCFELNSFRLDITFATSGIWRLTEAKMRVGVYDDKSNINLDFDADDDTYPYFWWDSFGAKHHHFRVRLNETDNCLGRDSFDVRFEARALLGRSFNNGTLIPGTNETAIMHRVVDPSKYNDSADAQSWVDYSVLCSCTLRGARRFKVGERQSGPACLDTSGSREKMCFSLENNLLHDAGAVCVEMGEYPNRMEVKFTSSSLTSLVRAEVWAGVNFASLPMASDGNPDVRRFPNKWSYSSGRHSWTTSFDIEEACSGLEIAKLYMSAHATVAQIASDGSAILATNQSVFAQGTRGGEWFELPIRCRCSLPKDQQVSPPPTSIRNGMPTPAPFQLMPEVEKDYDVCFDSPKGASEKCYTLLVEGRAAAGSLCLEIAGMSPFLNITFNAIAGVWGLVKSEVWVGSNPDEAPKEIDGSIRDPHPFPKVRYNSSGDRTWTTNLPLNVTENCSKNNGENGFKLRVLAHAVVGRLQKNGRMIRGDKLSAFAVDDISYARGDYDRGFDVTVLCQDCASGRAEYEIFPHNHILWR